MGDTLTAGQKLGRGDSLTSNNGAYTLTLQEDGNLVLAVRGEAVWATGTNGQGVDRAEVQKDGNFVLYAGDKPLWHSDTKGKKDVKLVIQDDRNVVLYSADGAAWSSRTETDAPPPPEVEVVEVEVAPVANEVPVSRRGPTPWCPATRCSTSPSSTWATATVTWSWRRPTTSPTPITSRSDRSLPSHDLKSGEDRRSGADSR